MPFVKLDCGLLDSTLWFERDAREVFLTALLLAEPREFAEPIPEIFTDRLEYTGWSAPPGWYGFVPAAGPGIVHRAMMDDEEGRKGLAKLAAPDPASRSQAFDGRRMIRVNGGYLILNYQIYREKDYTAAERSRRYREKKRHAVTSQEHTVISRPVTQAEAEEEEEEEEEEYKYKEGEGELATTRATALVPYRPKPRFSPPSYDEVAAYMISKHFANAATEAVKFVGFYDSKGWMVGKNPMKSWKGAVATWIIRAEESR